MSKKMECSDFTWIEEIEIFFSRNWARFIKDPYRDFVQGVKNIFIFLPMVWKHRSWDYAYIFEFWKFVLEKHKEDWDYMASEYIVDKNGKTSKSMKTAINLLDRMSDPHEYYVDKEIDMLEEKWGKPDIYLEKSISGFNWMKDARYEKLNEKQKKELNRKRREIYEREYKHFQRDAEYLGKILKRHGRSWWT